jgi:hypothetical protein
MLKVEELRTRRLMRGLTAKRRWKYYLLKVNSLKYELGGDRRRCRWHHMRTAAKAIVGFAFDGLGLLGAAGLFNGTHSRGLKIWQRLKFRSTDAGDRQVNAGPQEHENHDILSDEVRHD